MIAILPASADPSRERVALIDLRDAVERLAHRRGHDDPPGFFGDLALELVRQHHVCHEGYVSKGREFVFWLARQRLRDYHRRRASRPVVVEYVHEIESLALSVSVDAHRRTSRLALEFKDRDANHCDALAVLSQRAQEILARKYLLGDPNVAIARAVGITRDGVRSSIHRSRRRLEGAMGAVIVRNSLASPTPSPRIP